MTGAQAPAFVHLKVHSAYSLLEGAITIAKLAKLAVSQSFPALGSDGYRQSLRGA